MPQSAFKLWFAGLERFAVTRDEEPVPVLGYVSRNYGPEWAAERGGKILPGRYESERDAAQALVDLFEKDV
jgi:hypothetical protein